MKKVAAIIIILNVLNLPAWAETMSVLDMYNHEKHTPLFEAANIKCTLCHQNSKSYNRTQVNLQGCHKCHNNPKAPMPGPSECSLCHNKTLDPIKPRNHTASWPRIHGAFATQDSQKCNICHATNFCVDCHQQRDTIRQTMHPRNFRMIHSIEARANPARCDTCHVVNFCTNCHTTRALP